MIFARLKTLERQVYVKNEKQDDEKANEVNEAISISSDSDDEEFDGFPDAQSNVIKDEKDV